MKNLSQVMEDAEHSAEVKVNRKSYNSFIRAIFAGLFISLGSLGNIIISANTYSTNPGLARFLGAVVFPVGLIGIVVFNFELFTSNCINVIGLHNKKYSFINFLRNITIVYFGNMIGCIILGLMTYKGHSMDATELNLLQNMVHHKVSLDPFGLILKGILCNILVCGAVFMAYASKNISGKILGIWFFIMLFILLGYSHSVANMFYLSTALIYKLDITIIQAIYNLFFVTIGNFIGGALLTFTLNME